MAKIEWTEGAVRDLQELDTQVARRILKKLDWISSNSARVVPEPLAGEFKGAYKLGVGDWRVIYTAKGDTITIQCIGHRGEIYKLP